jgi:hypothetical protein
VAQNLSLFRAVVRCEEPKYRTGGRYVTAAREAYVKAGLDEEVAWCDREHAQMLIQEALTELDESNQAEAIDQYRRALALCERALPVIRRSDSPERLADCLLSRGTAMWKVGDGKGAASDFREAKAILQQMGDSTSVMLCDNYLDMASRSPWPV